jgi:hypothetical protein
MEPIFVSSDICLHFSHFYLYLLQCLALVSIIGDAKLLNELACYYGSKESIFSFIVASVMCIELDSGRSF